MPRHTGSFVALLAIAMFVGCASTPKPPKRTVTAAEVVGKKWLWVGIVTQQAIVDVKQSTRYTLTLGTNGRADVQADCNRGGGNYTIAEGMLSFSPIMSSRAACPADTQDALYLSSLAKTASFYIESGELNLVGSSGVVMRFKPEPPPAKK